VTAAGGAGGPDAAAAFLADARGRFASYRALGEGAMAQVRDEEFFVTLDADANSIAVIVRHVSGNMRSRFTDFLTTDGEKPDRDRDREFEIDAGTTAADVRRWWAEGWERVFAAVDALGPDDVLRTVTIRGEPHTVLQAVHRQVAHYAYHVGQIVLLARHMRGADWKSLSVPRGQSGRFNADMSRRFPPA
jgi:Protein of unknown function (DUF1572)